MLLAGCYAAFDWREFTWNAGGFSVLLPGKPSRESREAAIGAQRLTLEVFSLRVEGAVFGVGWADLPQGLDDAARARLLADARDGLYRNVGATPGEERIVSVGGHVAREFRGEGTRDGKALGIAGRVLATDRRFYQLLVIAPASTMGTIDVPLFLGSLKLRD
jgi:hypothetical protein